MDFITYDWATGATSWNFVQRFIESARLMDFITYDWATGAQKSAPAAGRFYLVFKTVFGASGGEGGTYHSKLAFTAP